MASSALIHVFLVTVISQTSPPIDASLATTHSIHPFASNTVSLYVYYNDSLDFIDLNTHRFKKQLKYSMHYALTSTIANFQGSNVDTINICSMYQHQLSTSYITNECEQSNQWVLSQQQLTANNAQSAVSIEIYFADTESLTAQAILDSLSEMMQSNQSIFILHIEECMNMDISIDICTNSNYDTTNNFVIINILDTLTAIENGDFTVELEQSPNDNSFILWAIALYLYDYCIYGFTLVCVILSYVAWMHAKYHGYDCVKYVPIVIYGIYVFDFYADVIFCIHLMFGGYIWLCIACAVCVMIPLVTQFGALFIFEEKWVIDKTLREKLSGWLLQYNKKLLIFALVSGSTYGAVELLNSNIFGLSFFSMGLTKKHLSQFTSKRLLTNIILENVPQLVIQSLYMFRYEDFYHLLKHFKATSMDTVLVTALISSLVSILTTFITLCATHKSLNIQSKDEFTFWMLIQSNSEIDENTKHCIYRRKALEKGLEQVLNVSDDIEISLCYKVTEGIMVAFNVYIDKAQRSKRCKAKLIHILNAAANFGALERMVRRVWKLDKIPFVTVLTKSGCIPPIVNLTDIGSKKGERRAAKLTLDLADYIVDELNGRPNLEALNSGSSSTKAIPVLANLPFPPPVPVIYDNVVSSVGFVIERTVSFDAEPYAL